MNRWVTRIIDVALILALGVVGVPIVGVILSTFVRVLTTRVR